MFRKLITFFSVIALCKGMATAATNLPPTNYFVANEGQWEEPFAFRADAGNTSFFITSSGLTIDYRQYEKSFRSQSPRDRFDPRHEPQPVTVRGHVLKMDFVNGSLCPEIVGEERLSSYSNYFIGTDSSRWRSRVGHYRRVVAHQVWPGIDVEYNLTEGSVEVTYHVQPSADPSQIRVRYEGLDGPLTLSDDGSLLLPTSLGLVKEKAPFVYQVVAGRQRNVTCHFQVFSDASYGFAVDTYDSNAALVIDPLIYSTYLGGTSGGGTYSVNFASDGSMIATGEADGGGFPTTPGAYQTTFIGNDDATVTKIAAGGDSILFSTYIGNRGTYVIDEHSALAPDGAVWIAGGIEFGSWPLTRNAFDSTDTGEYKGIVCLLSADGASLLLSSYLGGGGNDFLEAVCTDPQGYLYITGSTSSTDFPVTSNAMFHDWQHWGDGFLTVIEPLTHTIWYSTFIPSDYDVNPYGVNARGRNHVWVWGGTEGGYFPVTPDAIQLANFMGNWDGFFSLFDLDSNRLVYSSLWGGSQEEFVFGLSEWGLDTVLLTGRTSSADFFVTTGALDSVLSGGNYWTSKAFVTAIRLPQTIIASTFLGGDSSWNTGVGIGGGPRGITVVGGTTSNHFPVTPGAFDTIYSNDGQPGNNTDDIFMSLLDWHTSALQYSTYFGGGNLEYCNWVGFPSPDTVWFAGQTWSTDFPVSPNTLQPQLSGGNDGFISCFAIPNPPSTAAVRDALPLEFDLTTFPNPFNPSTTLSFTLSHAAHVKLKVVNVLGRLVCENDLGTLNAGRHSQVFDGSALASGVYWARLEAGNASQIRKMVLLR